MKKPILGCVAGVYSQKQDILLDKAILVGKGSGATRCEALVSVIGTSIVSKLDINFRENHTLDDETQENTNDMNDVVFLFNDFNQAYYKAKEKQKDNLNTLNKWKERMKKDVQEDDLYEIISDMSVEERQSFLAKFKEVVGRIEKTEPDIDQDQS